MLMPTLRRSLRGVRYLALTLLNGIAALMAIPLLVGCVMLIPVGGAGLVLLPRALEQLRWAAGWEQRRACRYIESEYVRRPDGQPPEGILARWNYVMRDPGTWRTLGALPTHAILGTLSGMVGLTAVIGVPATIVKVATWQVVPPEAAATILARPIQGWSFAIVGGLGEAVFYTALFLWGAPLLAYGYARLFAWMTAPSERELQTEQLRERVEELSHTRAEALQAHGSELRRIERDLHDGTQARLVALAMRVGIAERMVSDDPERATHLLREARSGAEDAMAELRDVIRTMYPPILTDRGLDGAVSALAGRCAVPTTVGVGELGTLPAAVEAAAYFVIAETLTNAAKHSQAESAQVDLSRDGAELRIQVVDDGIGGVREDGGTGLAGLRRRVAALDGTVTVTSPAGGPTTVEVVLPCAS